MPATPKIFISFSSADLPVATKLYSDLKKAGATVFQFHESATPGQTVWSEVFASIKAADIYIYLASKSAIKSKPVRKELEFANYHNLNSDKPAILLPLVLEPGLRLPDEIITNNFIPFDNYGQGIQHLFKFLDIQAPQPTPPTQVPPPTQPRTSPRSAAKTPVKPASRLSQKDDALSQAVSRFKAPATSQTGLSNPALNKESNGSIFGKYALIICLIALAAAVVGWLVNSLLIPRVNIEGLTSSIATWASKWSFIIWASKFAFWVATASLVYDIADDEYPIDGTEYALVTVKGMGIALTSGLLWNFLFQQVTNGSFSFLLICILVATATILFYAVIDVF